MECQPTDTYVYAQVSDGTLVTIRRPGNSRYAVDATIGLKLDEAAIFLFDRDGLGLPARR